MHLCINAFRRKAPFKVSETLPTLPFRSFSLFRFFCAWTETSTDAAAAVVSMTNKSALLLGKIVCKLLFQTFHGKKSFDLQNYLTRISSTLCWDYYHLMRLFSRTKVNNCGAGIDLAI